MKLRSYYNGNISCECYEYFNEAKPEARYPIFLEDASLAKLGTERPATITGEISDWKKSTVKKPLNRYCLKEGRTMYFVRLKAIQKGEEETKA